MIDGGRDMMTTTTAAVAAAAKTTAAAAAATAGAAAPTMMSIQRLNGECTMHWRNIGSYSRRHNM